MPRGQYSRFQRVDSGVLVSRCCRDRPSSVGKSTRTFNYWTR